MTIERSLGCPAAAAEQRVKQSGGELPAGHRHQPVSPTLPTCSNHFPLTEVNGRGVSLTVMRTFLHFRPFSFLLVATPAGFFLMGALVFQMILWAILLISTLQHCRALVLLDVHHCGNVNTTRYCIYPRREIDFWSSTQSVFTGRCFCKRLNVRAREIFSFLNVWSSYWPV